MKAAHAYLHFDGNCRAAMTFYGDCLRAEPHFTTFGSAPAELAATITTAPDRILHSEATSGPVTLMASDTLPGMPFSQGNNFAISIACESEEELQRLFAAFAQNGTITMGLHDAFWGGRFGMLTDQFGIAWMFSFRSST